MNSIDPRWAGLALSLLFAGLVINALRTGEAWSRIGRGTARAEAPVAFWMTVGLQTAISAACVAFTLHAWAQWP